VAVAGDEDGGFENPARERGGGGGGELELSLETELGVYVIPELFWFSRGRRFFKKAEFNL